jgi:hypothetical protein
VRIILMSSIPRSKAKVFWNSLKIKVVSHRPNKGPQSATNKIVILIIQHE